MSHDPHRAHHPWEDDRIAAALAGLRTELAVPEGSLIVDAAALERPARRGNRRILVAALVLLVAAIGLLAVAPAREAVADWLGLGSTEVRIDPDAGVPSDTMPALGDGAVAVDAARAADELGGRPPAARSDVDEAPQFAVPPEGGVLVRWPGHQETLWMQRPDGATAVTLTKLAQTIESVERVDGLGDDALWLGDSHVLLTPGRAVAARHVLLWVDGGLELRLEGEGSRDEMVAIALGLRS